LEEAIDTFNTHDVDFVQNLGDIIDLDWVSFDSILPVYDKLNPDIKNYQLLGNHDFSIDSIHKKELLSRLSMPDFYYSYVREGWRFIVLDCTDIAYFSNSLHNYDSTTVKAYFEKTIGKANRQRWNSGIGQEQQDWLKQQLDSAETAKQKVILFSHMPLRPTENSHNIWNNDEILEIIENSSSVVAFINGHNHVGEYIYKNGIHYITIFGMVDTKIGSYGILEIYKDSLVLQGYGNQRKILLDQ
jgi:3',5'-cyclic AMP phosphodiesterase CpdA